MTLTIPPQQLVVSAFIADLRARYGAPKVGDHEAPSAAFPHLIVYALDGGSMFVPGWFPERHVGVPLQVTCVGSRRDQAQAVADSVTEFVLGRNSNGVYVQALSTPPGWVMCDRLAGDAASGVMVEGSAPLKVYTVPLRFTLLVTPA